MAPGKPSDPNDKTPPEERLWRILHEPGGSTESTRSSTKGKEEAEKKPAEPEEAQRELHPENYIPQDSSGPVGTVPTDSSQLQKILADPDLVSEDYEYEAAGVKAADFDAAIRSFYRETEIAVRCKNHPEKGAVEQCPECQAYYCQACMVVRRGRLLCRDCAETLFVPTEEEVLAVHEEGYEPTGAEVTPEEHPEFQVGGTFFGLEGHPAHPVKRLVALALDLLVTRLCLVVALVIGGFLFEHVDIAALHLFHPSEGGSVSQRVFEAFVLMRPYMPWVIVFAVVDYIYFFSSLAFFNRTLGMSWTGCRVVTEWGDFVPFAAVALRTLVFMVCLGWPAILIARFFPAYRGPHDYAAGTLVINYAGVKRVDAYETVQIKL